MLHSQFARTDRPAGAFVMCVLAQHGSTGFQHPIPARAHVAANPTCPLAVAFARCPEDLRSGGRLSHRPSLMRLWVTISAGVARFQVDDALH